MVHLDDILGHKEIVRTLYTSAAAGRVAHAYLFSGPPGVGKKTTALAFAAHLLCSLSSAGRACSGCRGSCRIKDERHPDLAVVRPEGASIKISQVRQLIRTVQMGPSGSGWAVRILDQADAMTAEAANALLKTLEDPVHGVVFILVADRPQALLPTVVSRCQHLQFQMLTKEDVISGISRVSGQTGDAALLAASLGSGSLGRALRFLAGGAAGRDRSLNLIRQICSSGPEKALSLAQETAGGKEEVLLLLEMTLFWLRDILLYNETGETEQLVNFDSQQDVRDLAGRFSSERLLESITDVTRALSALNSSANVQLTLDVLFLRLAGFGTDRPWLEEAG